MHIVIVVIFIASPLIIGAIMGYRSTENRSTPLVVGICGMAIIFVIVCLNDKILNWVLKPVSYLNTDKK